MKSIAINPVDRTAAGAIITKAKAGNVPVVFFNREPFADDMNSWDKVY
jgi:methyl-galactoside transport system substrate-binding protein